jgi:hypothetical protein
MQRQIIVILSSGPPAVVSETKTNDDSRCVTCKVWQCWLRQTTVEGSVATGEWKILHLPLPGLLQLDSPLLLY